MNWLWGLLGCGAPISNDLFYEDEEFLRVLPSDAIGTLTLASAPPGDSIEFEASRNAAIELEKRIAPLRASLDAIGAASPTTRGSGHRSWEGLTAAMENENGAHLWFIDVDMVKQVDEMAWTMEAAPTGDAPRSELIRALSDEEAGTLQWNGSSAAMLYTPEANEDGIFSWNGSGAEWEILSNDGPPLGRWQRSSEARFSWEGPIAVTEDDLHWPGFLDVEHQDAGGWVTGQFSTGEEVKQFYACWNADGVTLWREGELGDFGEMEDCPVSPEL